MIAEAIYKMMSICRRASHPYLGKIRRVIINSGVGISLFNDFKRESLSESGFCETGWILYGYRRPNEAVITACLPAGPKAERWEHGLSWDRKYIKEATDRLLRLNPLIYPMGISHTHPYRCVRHSATDYSADSEWVNLLHGKEGVFSIGVAGRGSIDVGVTRRSGMEMHWYTLGVDDMEYRRVPCSYRWGHDLGLEAR